MRPRFLAPGDAPPPGALVVDGDAAGGAACYSHWPTAPAVPVELQDDTSTGMAVRAAEDPARWLAFDVVCNDHVDADGLLALACCCDPATARAHAPLLVAAAEAGDFSAWGGAASLRLALRLHQLVRDARALRGGAWQQAACDAACADLGGLIVDAARPDGERDAQVALVEESRVRLACGDGFAIARAAGMVRIAWTRRHGHVDDQFLTVHQEDDLPVWAIDAVARPDELQVLEQRQDGGACWWLVAPRHSWARTVRRPQVSWPDCERIAASLQDAERGGCRWIAGRQARELGFTCLLASGDGAGRPAPSSIAPETVLAAVRSARAER